ncbi:helix-turn-helix domain-containing protein [Streptomyces cinereoruber]|uniref:helix-turn-helix domain-containing protein n=1 Tax=Streptomyces cinereoruber TaxID=67260 RepID=UPI003C2D50B6
MSNEPPFDDEIEVFSSDAPPAFTMVPEWITYSDLKPAQRDFWTVLASCVNHGRPDNRVWPAGPELADAMKIKNPDQLKPYREALQSIGAVVITEKRYQNGMRRRYVYDVRFHPPKDYTGPRTRQEWLARRSERLAAQAAAEAADTAAFEATNQGETAGQPGTPKNGGAGPSKNRGAGASENGGAGTPENGGAKPDQQKPDQQKPQTALAARSAGDGRRPSTGSSARGTSSGSAAANGAGAPNRTSARSGREVLVTAEVQCVLEAFPDALREALVRKVRTDRPKTVIQAIEKQLAGGGLVQAKLLGNRVARRWVTHGYTKHYAEGTLTRPVGAVLAMLKPGPCPEPRCEDGKLDDGNPCRNCIEREKNHRADKERERRARAQEKEAELRRRACPYCKEDRGTAGQPCGGCAGVIDSSKRDAAAFVDQAVSAYRAQAGADDQAAAAFRARVIEGIENARQVAAAEGADALGQALAVRLAANDTLLGQALVAQLAAEDGAREQSGPTQQAAAEENMALAAGTDRPDPSLTIAIPAQEPWVADHCPGHENTGCPWDKPAVGTEGLCARCLIEAVKKQPAHIG